MEISLFQSVHYANALVIGEPSTMETDTMCIMEGINRMCVINSFLLIDYMIHNIVLHMAKVLKITFLNLRSVSHYIISSTFVILSKLPPIC